MTINQLQTAIINSREIAEMLYRRFTRASGEDRQKVFQDWKDEELSLAGYEAELADQAYKSLQDFDNGRINRIATGLLRFIQE